jgi:hypothetical protein
MSAKDLRAQVLAQHGIRLGATKGTFNNFQQKLEAASWNRVVHAEAMKLLQKMIDAKRQPTVKEGLKQLKVLVPTLVNSIMTEIGMLLPRRSEPFGSQPYQAIEVEIDSSVFKAAQWEIKLQINTPEEHVAQYEQSASRPGYHGMSLPECQCHEATDIGLPCPRMTALFRHLGGEECFPIQAIAERLFVKYSRFFRA